MKDYKHLYPDPPEWVRVTDIWRGRRVCMRLVQGRRRLIVLDSSQGGNDLNVGPYEVTDPRKKFYGTFTTIMEILQAFPARGRNS